MVAIALTYLDNEVPGPNLRCHCYQELFVCACMITSNLTRKRNHVIDEQWYVWPILGPRL